MKILAQEKAGYELLTGSPLICNQGSKIELLNHGNPHGFSFYNHRFSFHIDPAETRGLDVSCTTN